MKNFIRTSDETTFKKLLNEGLTFVGKEDKYWVLINDKKITFEDKDLKVHYSDKLFI